MIEDNFELDTQREETAQQTAQHRVTVGLLKANTLTPDRSIVLTPLIVKTLTNNNITVYTERKLGKGGNFIDLNYADVGALLEDLALPICKKSNLLVQLAPFTISQLEQLKDGVTIIAPFTLESISNELLNLLQQKKLTALSLHFIKNVDGEEFLQDILHTEEERSWASKALSHTILSLLSSLIFSHNGLSNPILYNAIFCYRGILTNKDVSQRASLPFTDLRHLSF